MNWEKIKRAFIKVCTANNIEPSQALLERLERGFNAQLEEVFNKLPHSTEYNVLLETSIVNGLAALESTLSGKTSIPKPDYNKLASRDILDEISWLMKTFPIIATDVTINTLEKIQDIARIILDAKTVEFNSIIRKHNELLRKFDRELSQTIRLYYTISQKEILAEVRQATSGFTSEEIDQLESLFALNDPLTASNFYGFTDGLKQIITILEKHNYSKTRKLQKIAFYIACYEASDQKNITEISDEDLSTAFLQNMGQKLTSSLEITGREIIQSGQFNLRIPSKDIITEFFEELKNIPTQQEGLTHLESWNNILEIKTEILVKNQIWDLTFTNLVSLKELVPNIITLMKQTHATSLEALASKNNLKQFISQMLDDNLVLTLKDDRKLSLKSKKLFNNEENLTLLLPAIIIMTVANQKDMPTNTKQIYINAANSMKIAYDIDTDKLFKLLRDLPALLKFSIFQKQEKYSYETLFLFGISEMSKDDLLMFAKQHQNSVDPEVLYVLSETRKIIKYIDSQNIHEAVDGKSLDELEHILKENHEKYRATRKIITEEKAESNDEAFNAYHSENIYNSCLYKELVNTVKGAIASRPIPSPRRKFPKF